MKLIRLRIPLAATTALAGIAFTDMQSAAALQPPLPDEAMFVILPDATATAATVVMQMPSGAPIPIGTLNPRTGNFTAVGLGQPNGPAQLNAGGEAVPSQLPIGTARGVAPSRDSRSVGTAQQSTVGQPSSPASLDSYGRLNAVPATNTPGLSDGSVFGVTNFILPRMMMLAGGARVGSANEFAAAFQATVSQTNSAASYEKAVLYLRATNADPSDYTNGILRDVATIELQCRITGGVLLGRCWSLNTVTTVETGTDGYGVGQELAVNNYGSDQPLTGTSTSKIGLHLVGGGTYGGTAALALDGKWHDGLVCAVSTISNDCVKLLDGTSTLAEITKVGAGNFKSSSISNLLTVGSFGYAGGGISTATFLNNCLNTTGTPYLSACLYGGNNKISAQYAIVGGNAANDNNEYGSAHFASTNFGYGAGDGQWGWRVLYGTIPAGGGAVRLKSQSGASYTTSNTVPIPLSKAMFLDCKLVAHTPTGGQDSANWSLDDALFDIGTSASTARLVGGSWTAKQASYGASGVLTPIVAADTTLGSVNITVTAASGGPWDLVARCFSTDDK